MPPSARTGPLPDDVHVTLGRLLATAETAAQSIARLTEDSSLHTRSIASMQTTVAGLDKTVGDLVEIVRDGNGHDSLVSQVRDLHTAVNNIRDSVQGVRTMVSGIETKQDLAATEIAKINGASFHLAGMRSVLVYGVLVLAWLIPTVISVYAAMGQWAAAK